METIGLVLIKAEDSSIPTFDTTLIHARAAVNFSLHKKGPIQFESSNRT